MHVLLVEDDLVLADGISRVLRMNGMVVDIVGTGDAADAMLQRSQIAIIVLDIGLPGIDGFEVVRRLRARGSTLPVLLLTARDAIQDRVRGLELGADDYLVSRSPRRNWWRGSARWRGAAIRWCRNCGSAACHWMLSPSARSSMTSHWNCRCANGRCSNI